jgi:hypothetical protein
MYIFKKQPMINYKTVPGTSQPARHADPEDPANIRELLLGNPHELSLLRERNPELAEALINGSFGKKSKL